MKSFAVFCLSAIGGITLLAVVAATGAAGLYCWHGKGRCDSLPRVRVVTETTRGTRVYDVTPRGEASVPAPEITPAPEPPASLPLAITAPVEAADADVTALRAELADAMRRVAELEAALAAERDATLVPAPTPSERPARGEDF